MITSIELGDFLSHSETKLEFGNGVTVYIGVVSAIIKFDRTLKIAHTIKKQ